MKKLITLVFAFFFCAGLYAQQWADVVHLKNGSIIKGVIIEDVPDVTIKIQTADGNVFVCQYAEIVKLTKEQVANRKTSPSHAEVQAQRRWDTSTLKIQNYGFMGTKIKVTNEAGVVFTQPMMAELIGEQQASVLFSEMATFQRYSVPEIVMMVPMLAGEFISLSFLFGKGQSFLGLQKDPWLGIGIGMFAGSVAVEVVFTVLSMPHYKKAKSIIDNYRYSNFSYRFVPSMQSMLTLSGDYAFAPSLSFQLIF